MDYRVELDNFNGPIDLLLYLIKRDELDIYDIPIHMITESYLGYLEQIRKLSREHGIDINIAGEFLVMAATLMEIKSAMLLPRQEQAPSKEGETTAAQDLSDPRFELVQQLLEYKRLKDNAHLLEQQQTDHFNRFPRIPADLEGNDEPPPLDMDEVQIWDLLEAFQRLMKDIGTRGPKQHEVTYDETPIDLHAADIQDRLTRTPRLSLRSIMVERKSKSEMIGMFLALLELIREKKVLVEHNAETDDFEIVDAPEEHKKTFVGASLTLSDVDAPEANDETSTDDSITKNG
jgi:segregation and condensation protein A